MSESRAIAAFTGLGVVLVGMAIVVTRLDADRGGVGALPAVATSTHAPPSPPASAAPAPPPEAAPRLMQRPSLSKTLVAFDFAGEIWTVPREGGEARRIVSGQRSNERPVLSPDGSQIAFTGMYDGNGDVYVVAASGGEPRRLTFHPGWDEAVAWTPDGKNVLLASMRETPRDLPKLFTVAVAGGLPEPLPLPSGSDAAYSPDGKRLAYVPTIQWQPGWKKYAGGQTTPVWIADLADSHVTKVPKQSCSQRRPSWAGDTVYFVSDCNGPARSLFAYDTKSAAVRELARDPNGFDVRWASAGPGAIVYETLGALHLYDLASGATRDVPVTISADLPQTRPHFAKVEPEQILRAAVSPTGKRVLFEAHGEILSVPAEKGDVRNLTRTPAVADRDPSWSPDGKWIAWLSDESGEYALYFRAPDGLGPTKKVDLGQPPSFFYSPRWSPDSKKILVFDKRYSLWFIDIEHADHVRPIKIDTQRFSEYGFDAAWSPDSRWVAYQKVLENHLTAIYLWSVDDKTAHAVTDGRSDAYGARFDRSGKVLWFLAHTDIGLGNTAGMTAMVGRRTSSLYAAVLQKEVPSPVAPQSDEEGADAGAKPDKEKEKDKKAADVKIDFDGIDQRIVAPAVERANYVGLATAAEGVVLLLQAPVAWTDDDYTEYSGGNQPPLEVLRFDLKERKAEKFLDKIDGGGGDGSLDTLLVTADGTKVLYAQDRKWFLAGADKPPKAGDGKIDTGALQVWVDPPAEWRQMYHEVWRVERDFLYDPGAHGLDLAAAEKVYAPFVAGLSSREDLNTLLEEALSNLVLGHVWSQGGAMPKQDRTSVGLLGADYRVEDGRYRIARILRGENWNPKLKAPLTQPGIEVSEGDFLLEVNGQDLKGDDGVYRFFQGTAGKQTTITVAPRADGHGSRKVTVVPVGNEGALRLRGWMEANRKKVDEMSGGRVGYVYIPDTQGGGLTNFNRYYFSQAGKDAVVLDERFNHGGQIADYIVDILQWKPLMGAMTREGQDITIPITIFGPKVMIANEMSGSGGDALPWMFKNAKIGPLVGTKTWGGLVGIGGYPQLVDGGRITAPRWALYGTRGEWEVENHGIAPDVEVEQDPALVRQGRDPQLERAVQLALDALSKSPPQKLARPAYPNYGPRLPRDPRATATAAR